MEPLKSNIHLTPEEIQRQRLEFDKKFRFFRGYAFEAYRKGQISDDLLYEKSDLIQSVRRRSLNTVYKSHSRLHIWILRITALVAILLLISLYFIPFPWNLFLFIIFLTAFVVVSFCSHLHNKRQSQRESINSEALIDNSLANPTLRFNASFDSYDEPPLTSV